MINFISAKNSYLSKSKVYTKKIKKQEASSQKKKRTG